MATSINAAPDDPEHLLRDLAAGSLDVHQPVSWSEPGASNVETLTLLDYALWRWVRTDMTLATAAAWRDACQQIIERGGRIAHDDGSEWHSARAIFRALRFGWGPIDDLPMVGLLIDSGALPLNATLPGKLLTLSEAPRMTSRCSGMLPLAAAIITLNAPLVTLMLERGAALDCGKVNDDGPAFMATELAGAVVDAFDSASFARVYALAVQAAVKAAIGHRARLVVKEAMEATIASASPASGDSLPRRCRLKV